MKGIRRTLLASVLALAVVAVPSLLVSAKALATLTVRGPGINGALAMNDAQGLMQLQQYGFFNGTALANPPQGLGEGYLVTGYLNLDGNSIPFEQGIYYPSMAGEPGYIHFTAAYDASTKKSTPVDRWGVVEPAAAAAFSNLLLSHGVVVQVRAAASSPQEPLRLPAAAALPDSLLFSFLVGGASMLLAGAMWAWRRRASVS